MNENTYPVAEWFVSPQGEGVHSGTLMFFLRLAGCTVGKRYPKEYYQEKPATAADAFLQLPIYTEQCTLYDGRTFACDTDYRKKERLTPRQILEEIPKNVQNVLITGGEPLMHNLDTLLTYLWGEGKKIYIETSGTIDKYISSEVWVAVSPKFNVYKSMLQRANEIKILIDKDFDITRSIETLDDGLVTAISIIELAKTKPVFLQPVNFENEVNKDNLQLCLDIQQLYPNFRVSPQMHKLFTQQTGQLVR